MSSSDSRLKNLMGNLGHVLNRPLTRYACYFLSILFLITILDVISVFKGSSSFTFIFTGTFIAYVTTLAYSILPRRRYIRWSFNTVVFSLIFIFFTIDFLSLYIYGRALNKDYAAAIVNTNEAEMREFATTYLSAFSVITALTLSGFLIYLTYKVNTFSFSIKKRIRYFFYLFLPICFFIFITCDADKRSIVGKMTLILTPEKTPDLSQVCLHPTYTVHPEHLPRNIVMIVGESLSKHHCSLYDYDRPTNPRLMAIRDTTNLFVFKNVISPATSTEPALKDVFTTYPEIDNQQEWYRCVTLFDMVKKAGYKSFWISNQSKKGLWDNTIGKFADLSDENYFVGNKFSGAKRTTTDDEIFELLRPLLDKDTLSHCFYTIHLMGSHPAFKTRYPEQFAKFSPESYTEFPEQQREKLSQYDNSVYFNDSIVAEIIHLFEEKETLVFYFSDHALDVYQSSENHAGHAKGDELSQKYGKDIPFLIYASPLYKQHYPQMFDCIKANTEQPLNTGYFFYMLMDILHISIQDKSIPDEFSPFKTSWTQISSATSEKQ